MSINKKVKISFFFLIFLMKFCKCANILGLMSVASPSHHIWNSIIMHALADHGHNITILSADIPKPTDKVPKNVHYIHLEVIYNTMYNSDIKFEINDIVGISPHKEIPLFYDYATKNNIAITKSNGFKQLLNYPDNFKFDLIVLDYTFNGIIIGFLHKFKYPPLVGVSAYLMPPNTLDYVGGHYYPGYIPFMSLPCDTNMKFFERAYNTFLYAYDMLYRKISFTPAMNTLMKEHFSKDIPHITELEQKMTLALVNSHPSINYATPIPPNVIEVGGVQIQDPQPLDKEIEEFMSKGKRGTILFSLGTNMKPSDVKDEKIDIILQVMQEFPDYHFLWKFDTKYVKRKIPSNVMTRTFYPQRDILAHPKLKLFVTHSGGLSTQESTWRGVPMVGIPLFVDQHRNIHKSILAGVAKKVDYSTMTVDSLKSAIHEVLTNKSYAENMKIRSQRFRDRPLKPLDTVMWWIEYILRHPKPQHLMSPVHSVGFFIANSFDILFFILLILICVCLILFKVLQFILSQTNSSGSKVKYDKKNK